MTGNSWSIFSSKMGREGKIYLDLFKRHLKAEGFIIIGIQCIFLDSCFLLLDAFPSLHEMDLHIWIWGRMTKETKV